jgi:flavin-dependent dehydrogenase
VLDRLKLNEICMEEAEKNGARLELGDRLDGETLDKIHKDSIIIGADGVPSLVASHFHFPPIGRHVLTYRAEYDYHSEDTRFAELYFDRKITPGFFAWIVPESNGITEIAVGVDSRYGNSKAAFEKFMQTQKAMEVALHSKQINGAASIIPLSLRKRFVNESEEVLLVGDAAGQTKSSTGGGIIFGGSAAIIAAKVVAAHIRNGLPLASYERKWRREFSKENRLHEASRRIYSSAGFGTMLRIMKHLGIESILSAYGDMDKPTKIVKNMLLRKKQHG